jgi:hypothetical protein
VHNYAQKYQPLNSFYKGQQGGMKMKSVFTTLSIFVVLLAVGCGGTSPQVVPESAQDHKHSRPNTKTFGEYHAHLHVYHRKGEIYLYLTDIHDDPKPIGEEHIHATMTLANGDQKQLEFEPAALVMQNFGRANAPTDKFSITGDWTKSIHKFNIKFMIPIGNKIYEVSFDYKTSDKEDSHHKHDE